MKFGERGQHMASGSWNDFRKERQRKRLVNEKEKLRRRMKKAEDDPQDEKKSRLPDGEDEEEGLSVKSKKDSAEKEREADDMFDTEPGADTSETDFQEALDEDRAFQEALQAVAKAGVLPDEEEEFSGSSEPDADDEDDSDLPDADEETEKQQDGGQEEIVRKRLREAAKKTASKRTGDSEEEQSLQESDAPDSGRKSEGDAAGKVRQSTKAAQESIQKTKQRTKPAGDGPVRQGAKPTGENGRTVRQSTRAAGEGTRTGQNVERAGDSGRTTRQAGTRGTGQSTAASSQSARSSVQTRRTAEPVRQSKRNAAQGTGTRPGVKTGSGTREKEEKPVRSKPAKPAKIKRERKPIPPAVLRRRMQMFGGFVLIVLLCGAIAGGGFFFLTRRTYHGYRVLRTSAQEDIVSTQYANFDGKILRYSTNNISLVSDELETLWIEACDMSNPIADIRGKHAVVADRDGTSLMMVSGSGVTGRATTPYPIVKVCVSEGGLVAAILNGNNDMWINFYGLDGSLIADNQTTLEDPGFPLDVALADNGHVMMVAFQYIDGSDTTSYVAFYNFGDVGQNADDRIVSGYTYKGKVVPEIEWLSGGQSVAFCDDGLVTFTGTQVPRQEREVEVQEEIVSTFCDEDTVGLIFKTNGQNKMYTMQVYNASGRLKFTRDFNIAYTTVKMSDDYILMYNSAQLCLFTKDGVQRYMGTVDGTINNVVKLGFNKYLLVLDTGVNIIRFR